MDKSNKYDVLIVGAGLSGLFCALHLQSKNLKTLLIDKNTRAGGLCGTIQIDDYNFLVGCYDFGSLLKKELKKFDIAVNFYRSKAIFYIGNAVIRFPVDLKTLGRILPYSLDLFRLIRLGKKNKFSYYNDLLNAAIYNPELKHILASMAYVFACSPIDLTLEAIKNIFIKEYGNAAMLSPVGGPQLMIDAIVKKYLMLGGQLKLATECLQIQNQEEKKCVITNKGNFIADYVVSSQPPSTLFPENIKPSLACNFLLLAVSKNFNYPADISTHSYFPSEQYPDWLEQINSGQYPEEFGFHVARADLPEQDDHFTLNVIFFLPADSASLNDIQKNKLQQFLLKKLEWMMPGITDALLYKRLVLAAEFSELHQGLSSKPNPYILPPGIVKKNGYDAKNNIYYIGTAVAPDGEQATSAISSGKIAAEAILAMTVGSMPK